MGILTDLARKWTVELVLPVFFLTMTFLIGGQALGAVVCVDRGEIRLCEPTFSKKRHGDFESSFDPSKMYDNKYNTTCQQVRTRQVRKFKRSCEVNSGMGLCGTHFSSSSTHACFTETDIHGDTAKDRQRRAAIAVNRCSSGASKSIWAMGARIRCKPFMKRFLTEEKIAQKAKFGKGFKNVGRMAQQGYKDIRKSAREMRIASGRTSRGLTRDLRKYSKNNFSPNDYKISRAKPTADIYRKSISQPTKEVSPHHMGGHDDFSAGNAHALLNKETGGKEAGSLWRQVHSLPLATFEKDRLTKMLIDGETKDVAKFLRTHSKSTPIKMRAALEKIPSYTNKDFVKHGLSKPAGLFGALANKKNGGIDVLKKRVGKMRIGKDKDAKALKKKLHDYADDDPKKFRELMRRYDDSSRFMSNKDAMDAALADGRSSKFKDFKGAAKKVKANLVAKKSKEVPGVQKLAWKSMTEKQQAEIERMVKRGDSTSEIRKKAHTFAARNNVIRDGSHGDGITRNYSDLDSAIQKRVASRAKGLDRYGKKDSKTRNARIETMRKRAELDAADEAIKDDADMISAAEKAGIETADVNYTKLTSVGSDGCNRLVTVLRGIKNNSGKTAGLNTRDLKSLRSHINKRIPSFRSSLGRSTLFGSAYSGSKKGIFIPLNCLNHGKCKATCVGKKDGGGSSAPKVTSACFKVTGKESISSGKKSTCASDNKGVAGVFVPESVASLALGMNIDMGKVKGKFDAGTVQLNKAPVSKIALRRHAIKVKKDAYETAYSKNRNVHNLTEEAAKKAAKEYAERAFQEALNPNNVTPAEIADAS